MELKIEKNNNYLLLAPEGRIDAGTSQQFDTSFNEAYGAQGSSDIILDLTEVEYLSSAGLRSVLKIAKLCSSGKKKLVLCGIQPPVNEVFRISGFAALLKITKTRDEAAAMISG